jgi:hypothetical protein
MKRAIAEGKLRLGKGDAKCFVLASHESVIAREGFYRVFGLRPTEGPADALPDFLAAENLKPFWGQAAEEYKKPIKFQRGNRVMTGFRAELLSLACSAFGRALMAGALDKDQIPVATAAMALLETLARRGREALGL